MGTRLIKINVVIHFHKLKTHALQIFFGSQTQDSDSSSLLKQSTQLVVFPHDKWQCWPHVVGAIYLQIVDDVCQQVRPFHPAARCDVVEVGEVDMKVIVGWQVVHVDSKLGFWHLIMLPYGSLWTMESTWVTDFMTSSHQKWLEPHIHSALWTL